jgi:hypothetical protein
MPALSCLGSNLQQDRKTITYSFQKGPKAVKNSRSLLLTALAHMVFPRFGGLLEPSTFLLEAMTELIQGELAIQPEGYLHSKFEKSFSWERQRFPQKASGFEFTEHCLGQISNFISSSLPP